MADAAFSEFFSGTADDPMYVQRWGGTARPDQPIVMVHGGAHTGVFWTMAPGGHAPGWAQYFAAQGWTAYVVDWPGVGRSRRSDDYLTMAHSRIEDSLIALLEQVGPAVLMGHSMGGGFALKVGSRRPELLRAIVALASAPLANSGTTLPNVREVPLDRPVRADVQDARLRFANGSRFPAEAFDHYYRSLVPHSPNIRNAAVAANAGFHIEDPSRLRSVPILFLAAEEDQATVTEPTARFLGVAETRLGRDWDLPGFAHSFPLEEGNCAIAGRIITWLAQHAPTPG